MKRLHRILVELGGGRSRQHTKRPWIHRMIRRNEHAYDMFLRTQ